MTVAQPTPGHGERAFLECLPTVERILAVISRRHALTSGDADDFASWARERLIANEYAVFLKFGGRSSWSTYLSVVLTNLYRDYRNHLWGRWRPSAAAQRLGPIGIRLDELLHRDGCSLREAIGILISAGTGESEAELRRMAAKIPTRAPDEDVGLDVILETVPGTPDDRLAREEREAVVRALRDAIVGLSSEDRLITQMRFWDGVSVADIARLLRLDQKPLYRRIEAIQRQLEAALIQAGINGETVRDMLAEGA